MLRMNDEIKPRLLELIEVARANKRAFIDGLSAAERDEVAPAGQWTARDYITHVTFWEEQRAIRVAAQLRGEEPPPSLGEDDEVNARVQAQYGHRSWADVEAEVARVDAVLRDLIAGADAAALADPDWHPSLQHRPVWLGIADNVFDHPAIHYADYYLAQGDLARATRVRETAVATLARLFHDTPAYTYALYNLGCFYALTGQADQALAAVGEALKRAPDLAAWAGQDSELDSLHDLPAFQAMVAEPPTDGDGAPPVSDEERSATPA
jgi:tetratricopeptide (TPR) repeat protein